MPEPRWHEKSGRCGPLFRDGRWIAAEMAGSSLHAFFAEAGADGGTLTGLEFRVRLADDVDRALALDDLTIGVAALGGGEGGKNFHGMEGLKINAGGCAGARTLSVKAPM